MWFRRSWNAASAPVRTTRSRTSFSNAHREGGAYAHSMILGPRQRPGFPSQISPHGVKDRHAKPLRGPHMHHSRLCAVLIDCRTSDVDAAARFWGEALGRPVDLKHRGSRGNYRMLETPPDEPIVQIQRVSHESRVHIDIETDDIPAEVARLEKLGAEVVDRLERWVVMQAPTGQRFCIVRLQRPGFPKNANRWD